MLEQALQFAELVLAQIEAVNPSSVSPTVDDGRDPVSARVQREVAGERIDADRAFEKDEQTRWLAGMGTSRGITCSPTSTSPRGPGSLSCCPANASRRSAAKRASDGTPPRRSWNRPGHSGGGCMTCSTLARAPNRLRPSPRTSTRPRPASGYVGATTRSTGKSTRRPGLPRRSMPWRGPPASCSPQAISPSSGCARDTCADGCSWIAAGAGGGAR